MMIRPTNVFFLLYSVKKYVTFFQGSPKKPAEKRVNRYFGETTWLK